MEILPEYEDYRKKLCGRGLIETREIIDSYLDRVRISIGKASKDMERTVEKFGDILKEARVNRKEVMFLGTNYDYHLVSHANVDFLKMNSIRVVNLGIPELTAFGNDYPYPLNFAEIIKMRGYGEGTVVVGIEFGGRSELLAEALKYNYDRKGVSVLITDREARDENAQLVLCIDSENKMLCGDIAQMIFHYLSANIANSTTDSFFDDGAESFSSYCGLLLESLNENSFLAGDLVKISMAVRERILMGSSVFTFGNGGSAAIASYFAESIREVCSNLLKPCGKIYDITSLAGCITSSINGGNFNGDAFTRIIRQMGIERGDVLFGVSSSGNSPNIIHPFTHIEETISVGILGFGDGGKIGRDHLANLPFIVPDAGGSRSYQRAEDGQRIAVSSILNTFL